MSAGFLLIDGYNLLHAARMGQRDYRPGDLLRCRTRLLRFLLSKLSAAEIKGATVVFDARDPPPDRPAQVVVSGIKVLFANPGGDADVLIQDWLSRQPAPRRVTLVSSDKVLQRAARGCGSKFVGSEDFVHELERRRVPRAPGRRSPDRRSPGRKSSAGADDSKPVSEASSAQTTYWLKVFGDAAIVEPDDGALPSAAAAESGAHQTRPAPTTAKGRSRSRRRRLSDESKPPADQAAKELAYWMNVFGNQTDGGASSASADELRLADLEDWVKELEATERRTSKNPPGPSKGA